MDKKEYNPNEEREKELITDYEHYQEEKEFEKESKSNDEIMREKVNSIITDFNEINEKEEKRKRIKTIILVVAILLEVVVIIYILNNRKTEKTYKMNLVCTSNNIQTYSNYSVKMETTYYFNQKDKVAKISNAAVYVFDDNASYRSFMENIVTEKTNFRGVDRKSAQDDIKNVYKAVTTYDFDELRKNKKVKFDGNIINFTLPGDNETTTLMIQGYDDVLETNKMIDFTCE